MADKKISALTPATTPLAGTEVLPIVQGAATVKVATNDLTVKNVRSNATTGILQVAGPDTGTTRVMTTPNANFTAARTDAAQTFSGLQVFASPGTGNENIRFTDGTKSSTIQQSDSQTFFNGNISLAAPAVFTWRHTNSYTQLMQLTGATGNLTLNSGDVVIGTAGKGIDFSANTHAAGMTSELLNDYEEGTFTPTITSASGTLTSYTGTITYVKTGTSVVLNIDFTITNYGTGSGVINVTLPFTAKSGTNMYGMGQEIVQTGQRLYFNMQGGQISVTGLTTAYPAINNSRFTGSLTYIT
jgi:hypothetical protein